MQAKKIIVYGAEWCGDCRRTKRFLEQHLIPFDWINVDQDRAAEKRVLEINRGMRSIPTIVFEDGSSLVEPSNRALEEKLNLLELA